jgi:hypothetical protein
MVQVSPETETEPEAFGNTVNFGSKSFGRLVITLLAHPTGCIK